MEFFKFPFWSISTALPKERIYKYTFNFFWGGGGDPGFLLMLRVGSHWLEILTLCGDAHRIQ